MAGMATERSRADERQAALERFEQAVELPLFVLAVAMIPLLLAPLVVDLDGTAEDAVIAADWFVWAAFAVEYVIRLVLTPAKLSFVRREWPDLLIVLLPFLRPLRVVRSARALRVLRLARLAAFLGEATKEGRSLLTRHSLQYVMMLTLAVVVGAGTLIVSLEEGGEGNIQTVGDGLWWAITTVTTVGYGDRFPVTPAGRGLAAALMVAGIAFFGVLTANVAAFFLERDRKDTLDASEDPIGIKLDEIARRLEAIERRLPGDPS